VIGAAVLPLWLVLRAAAALPATPPSAPSPVAPPPAATRPIRRVETQQPQVALTFDACATKNSWYGFDRDVFDILKREQVPATVFVSGLWVETHPEAMADLTGDPLIEFGDHSYDHPHMTKLGATEVGAEIDETEAALGRYGRHAVAFRPPFGEWNANLVQLVRARQLPTVTWDVVSGDPSTHSTTASIVKAVLHQARPGSIIVFHINGRGWKTHEALPEVLAGLRARGFKLVSLSELLQGEGPGGVRTGVQAAASELRPAGP
jgi:peptidoglycan/xylan/chitin deacetylase (PgdA/CDA1 family)